MVIGITGSLCFLFCWKGKSTATSRSRITHKIYFAANGRLGFNLTVQNAYTECTWQTINTPTSKLNNPCAWQAINSQSHKPINSQAHKLRHATTNKRSCLWTYKLTNTSTDKLNHAPTQYTETLNLLLLLYKTYAIQHPFLAKNLAKK